MKLTKQILTTALAAGLTLGATTFTSAATKRTTTHKTAAHAGKTATKRTTQKKVPHTTALSRESY